MYTYLKEKAWKLTDMTNKHVHVFNDQITTENNLDTISDRQYIKKKICFLYKALDFTRFDYPLIWIFQRAVHQFTPQWFHQKGKRQKKKKKKDCTDQLWPKAPITV